MSSGVGTVDHLKPSFFLVYFFDSIFWRLNREIWPLHLPIQVGQMDIKVDTPPGRLIQ